MKHGSELLKVWMGRMKMNQRTSAEYLKFDETFFCKLVKGQRNPGLTNAVKIERATGIPVEAWQSSLLTKSTEPVGEKSGKR